MSVVESLCRCGRSWPIAQAAAVAVLVGACQQPAHDRPALRVAAAASLTDAFEELGRAFEREHAEEVSFTFGSSGLIARQIVEGAPFDVFAAADLASIERVSHAACDASTTAVFAHGRLSIWSRPQGQVAPATSLRDLADARFRRIAVANPETAPYGKAACEALVHAGVWDAVAPRIVYGENVRQTLQLAETGNAEVALVARSLLLDRPGNAGLLVDASQHAPLEHALIACSRGSSPSAGREFVAFVRSTTAQAILDRHGLDRPALDARVVP